MFAKNINSTVKIEHELDLQVIKNAGFLMNLWNKIPVYLVDEELIDTLYPPQKRKLFSIECLQEILLSFNNNIDNNPEKEIEHEIENIDKFWKNANKCVREADENDFIAGGLYRREINNQEAVIIKEKSSKIINQNQPNIFICPERINSWVSKVSDKFHKHNNSTIFKTIYEMILYHELAHGYMDRKKHSHQCEEIYEKVIEESLANAISNSRFTGYRKAIVNFLMSNQPLEYSLYTFWVEFDMYLLKRNAKAWGESDIINSVLFPFIHKDNYHEIYHKKMNYIRRISRNISESNEIYLWKIIAKKILEEIV